jgi:DNA-binding MarR family transcriptional regulator
MHISTTPATTSALEFCLALSRAAKVLSRRIDGRLGSLHGISFADFAILLQLGRAPGGRLRRIDLAEQLGLTASAVTRALIPLEKIGLVSRKADSNDARVSLASLTAAGRRILEESLETAEMLSRDIVPEDDPLTDCSPILDRLLSR